MSRLSSLRWRAALPASVKRYQLITALVPSDPVQLTSFHSANLGTTPTGWSSTPIALQPRRAALERATLRTSANDGRSPAGPGPADPVADVADELAPEPPVETWVGVGPWPPQAARRAVARTGTRNLIGRRVMAPAL